MDPKDLKIAALLERIASLASQYEDQDADRRVEITILSQENQQLKAQLEPQEVSNEVPQEVSAKSNKK